MNGKFIPRCTKTVTGYIHPVSKMIQIYHCEIVEFNSNVRYSGMLLLFGAKQTTKIRKRGPRASTSALQDNIKCEIYSFSCLSQQTHINVCIIFAIAAKQIKYNALLIQPDLVLNFFLQAKIQIATYFNSL